MAGESHSLLPPHLLFDPFPFRICQTAWLAEGSATGGVSRWSPRCVQDGRGGLSARKPEVVAQNLFGFPSFHFQPARVGFLACWLLFRLQSEGDSSWGQKMGVFFFGLVSLRPAFIILKGRGPCLRCCHESRSEAGLGVQEMKGPQLHRCCKERIAAKRSCPQIGETQAGRFSCGVHLEAYVQFSSKHPSGPFQIHPSLATCLPLAWCIPYGNLIPDLE